MPHTHPRTEFLRDYASGTCSEGASLAISTHLAMCTTCRHQVEEYEALGGSLLMDIEDTPVTEKLLKATLSKLSDVGTQASLVDKNTSLLSQIEDGDIILPRPLRDYTGAPTIRQLEHLNWSHLPGYAELDLSKPNSETKIRLLRIAANKKLPQHTHEGSEFTVVLKGSFKDNHTVYSVGDLCVADSTTNHSPHVSDEGECICLAITDAPLKLTGPLGRMLNPFIQI